MTAAAVRRPEIVPCAYCGRDCDQDDKYAIDADTPYCSEECADYGTRSKP